MARQGDKNNSRSVKIVEAEQPVTKIEGIGTPLKTAVTEQRK